jgi:hypothetical protein
VRFNEDKRADFSFFLSILLNGNRQEQQSREQYRKEKNVYTEQLRDIGEVEKKWSGGRKGRNDKVY